jgi:hypothetical protein
MFVGLTRLVVSRQAGGQHDGVTSFGELAAHLAADAAIAAGNQRDGAHIVDCLHNM